MSVCRRAVAAATKASVETTFDTLPDSARASVNSTSTTATARSSIRATDSPPPRPPKPGARKGAQSGSVSSEVPEGGAVERLDNLTKSTTLDKDSGVARVASPNGHKPTLGDSNINLKGIVILSLKV